MFLRSDDDLHAEVLDLLGPSTRTLSCTVSDGRVALTVTCGCAARLAMTRLVVPGVVAVDCRVRWDVDDVEVATLVP